MGIDELFVLKAKYDRDFLIAEAKVAVIDDIIEMYRHSEVKANADTCEESSDNNEDAVEPNITVDESY